MEYLVEHITDYRYSEAVTQSQNQARLRPRETPWQQCLSHEIELRPASQLLTEHTDGFGNQVWEFSLHEPHDRLSIRVCSRVRVDRTQQPLADLTPAWEDVAMGLRRSLHTDDLDAVPYVFPTALTPTDDEFAEYAMPSFTPRRPILSAGIDLMQRVHADFTYDKSATDVSTPTDVAFRSRRGVCQDFAHAMLACLRTLGLPARYVSGYLLTQPRAGQPRLVGADASHAWVSLYIPTLGWIDLDPTNDVLPSDQHITLAWGCDYRDVAPLRGIVLGGGQQRVSVGVTVTPFDATSDED